LRIKEPAIIRYTYKVAFRLLIIFYCILFLFSAPFADSATVVFHASWGEHFPVATNEQGEQLGISASFYDDSLVYLYNSANRSVIVVSTPAFQLLSVVSLQSVGRGTWVGDDFVVFDDTALFLNTIDYRLEYFSLKTGHHLRSVPFERDLFSSAQIRIKGRVTSIFLINGDLLLSNGYDFVSVDKAGRPLPGPALAKRKHVNGAVLLYDNRGLVREGQFQRQNLTHWRQNRGPFMYTGKNLFRREKTTYAVKNSTEGFSIVEVK